MGGADAIPHCVPLQGYSLPQCKGFLPTPFSKHFPIFMLFGGLTWACSWLNNRNFQPVESMSAEYKAAEAKNIITRTDAPPVFINPIRNGLPGNILGPEDLERRG
jgi:hypothetical protein